MYSEKSGWEGRKSPAGQNDCMIGTFNGECSRVSKLKSARVSERRRWGGGWGREESLIKVIHIMFTVKDKVI